MTDPVAVIDIGSMSTRLLIDNGDPDAARRIEIVTRLASGLAVGGTFDPAALARVGNALTQFGETLVNAGLDPAATQVVATAAARRAVSAEPLVQIVAETLGAELEVLDSATEGRLAFAGASRHGGDGSFVVLDIGGASTEFTVGTVDDGVLGTFSADIGASSITEQFLESDPPHPAELSSALSVIELHMVDVAREVPLIGTVLASGGALIGVGGTISTAAAVEVGLQIYDPDVIDGFVLERAASEDVFRTLATEPAEDRGFNPGLAADRVDVIVGGLCILVGAYRAFDLSQVTVSVADLMDGVVARWRQ